MKAIKKINKILRWTPFGVLLGLFAFMVYYNYTLQNQVDERNAIIRDLAFSDSLVQKYFDIEEDSLHNSKFYTLKDEYSPKEIHHYTTETVKETYTEYIEDSTKYNAQHNQIVDLGSKYNALVRDYNSLVATTNQALDRISVLKDSLQMQKMALSLIKRNFDIDFIGKMTSGKIVVELTCEKADSAFMVFPYYKEKLKYNQSKKVWEIKK